MVAPEGCEREARASGEVGSNERVSQHQSDTEGSEKWPVERQWNRTSRIGESKGGEVVKMRRIARSRMEEEKKSLSSLPMKGHPSLGGGVWR